MESSGHFIILFADRESHLVCRTYVRIMDRPFEQRNTDIQMSQPNFTLSVIYWDEVLAGVEYFVEKYIGKRMQVPVENYSFTSSTFHMCVAPYSIQDRAGSGYSPLFL